MVPKIRATFLRSYNEIIILHSKTTQNIANLQNGVRRLQIIVFCCPYDGYNQRDISELSP